MLVFILKGRKWVCAALRRGLKENADWDVKYRTASGTAEKDLAEEKCMHVWKSDRVMMQQGLRMKKDEKSEGGADGFRVRAQRWGRPLEQGGCVGQNYCEQVKLIYLSVASGTTVWARMAGGVGQLSNSKSHIHFKNQQVRQTETQ